MPLFEDYPDYGQSYNAPTPKAGLPVIREQLGCVTEADRMFLEDLALEHNQEFQVVFRRSGLGSYVTIETQDSVWVGWVKHQLADRERRVHELKDKLGMKYAPLPPFPAHSDGFDVHRHELIERKSALGHIRLKSVRSNQEPEHWR